MTVSPAKRRFPAEWEPQDAVLLAWPRPQAGWGDIYEAALDDYATLVATILHYQPVLLCIPAESSREDIESRIFSKRIPLSPLTLIALPGNDSWARDFGPIGVLDDGQIRLLDFQFNGWGNKYPAELDNSVSQQLAGKYLVNRLQSSVLVMEGGSLDSNGAGALLTTSRCLLHPQRNPAMDLKAYEEAFSELLGINQVHWIENGWLAGDDTDGHIDMLARFTQTDTIVYTLCEDEDDEHYPSLHALHEEMVGLRQHNGEPYKLVTLPFPTACFSKDGDRLPASYANFLIINDAVLCPVYDVPEDEAALEVLNMLFPDRQIEPLPARHFIHQGGSIHCLTMQLFSGTLATQ